MNHVIERSPVTTGFKAMLLAGLVGAASGGRNLYVEIGSAPQASLLNKDEQGRLIDPYGIIYPVTSVLLYGSYGYPQDGATVPYQVTSVGRNRESAEVMSDLVRKVVTVRTGGGSWVHPLNAGVSMSVVDRRCREFGTSESIEGLWQVSDVFELEVQAA